MRAFAVWVPAVVCFAAAAVLSWGDKYGAGWFMFFGFVFTLCGFECEMRRSGGKQEGPPDDSAGAG